MLALVLFLVPLVAADCPSVLNTLTSDCRGECSTCVVYQAHADDNPCNSAAVNGTVVGECLDADDDGCQVQCFGNPSEDGDPYRIHISNNRDEMPTNGDMQNAPYLSAGVVHTIGPLSIPSDYTTLSIQGGNTVDSVGGDAVFISVDDDLLKSSPSIQVLELVNIDMSNSFLNLPAIASQDKALVDFHCSNCELTEMPTSLTDVKNLITLRLRQNKLTSVPSGFSHMNTLTTLDLASNNITSFHAASSSLQVLKLTNNSMTTLPQVLENMTSLIYLDVSGNPFEDIIVSNKVYDVLKGLTYFTSETVEYNGDCDDKRTVGTMQVCIGDMIEGVAGSQDQSHSISVGNILIDAVEASSDSSTADSSGISPTTLVVVIVIAGIIVLLLCGIIWYFYRRNKKQQKLLEAHNLTTHSVDPSSVYWSNDTSKAATSDPLWTAEERVKLQLRYEDVKDIRRLGSGGYADVWLVQYCGKDFYASKRLLPGEATVDRVYSFVEEVKLSASLQHPKIVQLFGAAWTVEANVQALYEYMPKGNVRTYLQHARKRKWRREKLQIAIDVSVALTYIHSFDPPLLHRDLKSTNVLLSETMEAKLGDFGTARFMADDSESMTVGAGTGRWIAPEVLSQRYYCEKSDIYSFGVLLSEMDTHELPFDSRSSDDGNELSELSILHQVMSGQLKPTFLDACPPKLKQLAQKCLSYNPNERPASYQVRYELHEMLKEADARSERRKSERLAKTVQYTKRRK